MSITCHQNACRKAISDLVAAIDILNNAAILDGKTASIDELVACASERVADAQTNIAAASRALRNGKEHASCSSGLKIVSP